MIGFKQKKLKKNLKKLKSNKFVCLFFPCLSYMSRIMYPTLSQPPCVANSPYMCIVTTHISMRMQHLTPIIIHHCVIMHIIKYFNVPPTFHQLVQLEKCILSHKNVCCVLSPEEFLITLCHAGHISIQKIEPCYIFYSNVLELDFSQVIYIIHCLSNIKLTSTNNSFSIYLVIFTI